MHSFAKTILVTILVLTTLVSAYANPDDHNRKTGAITGVVVDKENKEPLVGATVRVEGQPIGGVTDLDGNFQLEGISSGEVTLIISYISYNTLRLEELIIKANEITRVEVALDASQEQLQEFVVTAKANRESENLLLLEQKQSLLAVKAMAH